MRIDDATLLDVWERGYGRPPFLQALLLLSVAAPDLTVDRLMDFSIGSRDRAILSLRKQLFGTRIDSIVNCPKCSAPLELNFQVDDIVVLSSTGESSFRLSLDALLIEYRLPTSRDLIAVLQTDRSLQSDQLMRQCITKLERNGKAASASSLTSSERSQLAQAIADSDPQADVQLQLSCLECECKWHSAFDIIGFLWTELNAWCQRLMSEIHLLARTYGWSQHEILSLSRWRRQVFLGMVRQ